MISHAATAVRIACDTWTPTGPSSDQADVAPPSPQATGSLRGLSNSKARSPGIGGAGQDRHTARKFAGFGAGKGPAQAGASLRPAGVTPGCWRPTLSEDRHSSVSGRGRKGRRLPQRARDGRSARGIGSNRQCRADGRRPVAHDPQPEALAPCRRCRECRRRCPHAQPGDAAAGFHVDPDRVGLRVLHGVGDRLLGDAVQVRDRRGSRAGEFVRSPSTCTRSL